VEDRSPLGSTDILSGRNVYLRPPKRSELNWIRGMWSDPDTMKDVGGPMTDFSNERAAKWFVRMIEPGRSTGRYCLIFTADHQPVGEVSFHKLDCETMTAWLNIKIASKYRGRVVQQVLSSMQSGGRVPKSKIGKPLAGGRS
jgi:hypothetical protein